eukprot:UN24571
MSGSKSQSSRTQSTVSSSNKSRDYLDGIPTRERTDTATTSHSKHSTRSKIDLIPFETMTLPDTLTAVSETMTPVTALSDLHSNFNLPLDVLKRQHIDLTHEL